MLNNSSLSALEKFYQYQDNATIFQSPVYIRGLLFAVCASPDIPMPEQWFPWVVKQGGEIQSHQVDKVANILMQLLKEQLRAMRDDKIQLPADCHFAAASDSDQTESDQTDREKTANLQAWMSGLTAGHGLLEPVWQEAWQIMMEKQSDTSEVFAKDLSRCLRMFSTFADIELATQQARQRGAEDFQDKLPVLAKSISGCLRDYVRLSGDLVSFLPNQFDTFQKQMPGFH